MNKHQRKNSIKKLYINEFQNLDYETARLDEIVVDLINSSEGVYFYRAHNHLLNETVLLKWLREETSLIPFKEIRISFECNNKFHNIIPKNDESIYFLKFTEEDKQRFLKKFKISIRDIKNVIGTDMTRKFLKKSIYIDDPLYDQYDFIFTKGDEISLLTDIHTFNFLVPEVRYDI